MEKQRTEGRIKLVLVPAPFQGHMTPMLQLGTVLHSKGFSITVAHTNFNAPNPSNHPDFTFYPLSNNSTDDEISKSGFPLIESVNSNCKTVFQHCLAQIMKQKGESDDRLGAIIHDNLMYFAEDIAYNLKLPSLVFRASNASYLWAYLAVPRLHEEGYLPLKGELIGYTINYIDDVIEAQAIMQSNLDNMQYFVAESKLQDLVPELHPLLFKDLPLSGFSLEDTLKWLKITSGTKTSSAIIWNTMDFMEHTSLLKLQQHFQVPVFAIGPLHVTTTTQSTSFLTEDRSCIEWLDKQAPKSVIYASIGSGATMDEKELVETAWGLANSDQPFLWVVRPGSVSGSEWIELLPEGFTEKVGDRGFIVKWAPQKEVLAHAAIGGFWSHCGWNSSLESICQGVPMICRPCFFDQKVNARYLSYVWKVGLELEQVLERGEIANAIRRLLVDKEGEEVRQRAIEMKEKVKACVQEGGSSYETLNELIDFLVSLLPK